MSNIAINAVRESSLAPAGLRLVALILADAAGRDDGGALFLSMQSIANRCAMSKDQARRHVRDLRDQGFLTITRHGRGPLDTNDYQLNVFAFQQQRAPWAVADERRRALRRRVTSGMGATSTGATSTDASSTDAIDPLHGCSRPLAPMQQTPGTHATQSPGIPPTHQEGGVPGERKRTPPARRAGAGAPAGTGRSYAANPPAQAADIDWSGRRDRAWV